MKSLDEYIAALVDVPANAALNGLSGFRGRLDKFIAERPKELPGFKNHILKIGNFKKSIDNLKFEMNLENVRIIIMDDFTKERDAWVGQWENDNAAIDQQIIDLKESIEASNKEHNANIINQNNADNSNYNILEDKRKELESYSDKIFSVCSQYGITTSMVDIDESQYTFDELNNLYDGYLAFMKKESKGTNVIAKFRHMVPNELAQGGILLAILGLCLTEVLDFISIGFFLLLAYNQIQNMDRFKYYSILLAIVFNIKPENMGYTSIDDSQFLPEELTMEMLDEDPRFGKFSDMYDELESKYTASDPAIEQSKVLSEWQTRMSEFDNKIKDYIKKYNDAVEELKQATIDEIKWLQEEYQRLIDAYKFIGDRWSKHLYFTGNYTLGIHDDCIEENIDTGTKNIIIRTSRDEASFRKFIQALVVNAIGNVKPGNLEIICYDPNDFGRRLTPLWSDDVKDYIKIISTDLKPILDELTDYCQDNFKEMSGRTVNEFNAEAEEKGITPIIYKLLIILSQPKTVEEDEQLSNFIKYSSTGGVYIWIVSDTITSDDCYIFNKPFDGIPHPILDRVNDDWCRKISRNYAKAIKDAAPPALMWRDFEDSLFNSHLKDGIWSGDASKFIDFWPGYENGDPTLARNYTVGNEGNVHAIGVGTSGAGKSVFLNHLVNTMCREYSPNDLELWLCDFKGVEFKAYMKLPRLKAARLCKPQKVQEGEKETWSEEDRDVFGYYKCQESPEGTEYVYSPIPTAECSELHKFTQEVNKKTAKIDINDKDTVLEYPPIKAEREITAKDDPNHIEDLRFPPKTDKKTGKEKVPQPKGDQDYPDNIEYYALPHISACLCTSDGAFATSLFKAYRTLAEHRYDDLGFISVKNMPGWNAKVKGLIGSRKPDKMIETHTKLWKEQNFNPIWTDADLWPRVLFICDEFQVIFQKADPKDVDQIKADIQYIAKVARACGMHIFFTSQSMKGTVSADILANFTLRFALRCEPEVSMDIIGTKRAAEIREKNGYLIVQSQEMKSAEDQKRFKTPFLNDEPGSGKYTESELFDNIRMLNNKAEETKKIYDKQHKFFRVHDVITYDEKVTHKIEELAKTWELVKQNPNFTDQGVFFLGNRMAYSSNKAPDNIILSARNNTNIISCFTDTTDFVQFFKEMVFNIKQNKVPGTIIINSQVEDLSYLCSAEEEITFPEKHGHLLSNKNSCVQIIDWCEKLYQARQSSGKKDTPIWIFLLGWDKGKGFAIDPDPTRRTKFAGLMQTAGEYNIHFILINTAMTGIAQSIITACKHRIAGKCSLDDSTAILMNKSASLNYEIKTGWMFSWNDGVITRDKIYISPLEREIASSEVIL